MKFFILALLALLLTVFAAGYAPDNLGILTFTSPDLTVQTSITFSIILVFISFIFLYTVIRVLVNLVAIPDRIKAWRKLRYQRLSEKYLSQGLHALIEGNWHRAEIMLNKGASFSKTPFINHLCAARAAQNQGALLRRDNYLKLAYENTPEETLAVGLTQAELQINQKQAEQALATLRNLHEKHPSHGQIKCLLLQTYAELEDWIDVLELLPKIKRDKLLSPENIQARQLEAYAGLMYHAGQDENKKELDRVWGKIPKKIRGELHLLEVYATEKLKFADTRLCEPLLRKALRKQWDVAIIRLYGLIEGHDNAKQLVFAESLLNSHARDPDLFLTLGRLCIRNGLWGKAKGYLEESIDIQPSPEAYRELATLVESQGDHKNATVYYQLGLKLATAITYHDSVKLIEQAEANHALCDGARQVV